MRQLSVSIIGSDACSFITHRVTNTYGGVELYLQLNCEIYAATALPSPRLDPTAGSH
jgi:hypothetical protein